MRGLVAVAVLVAACGGRDLPNGPPCDWKAWPTTGCPYGSALFCDDPTRNKPNLRAEIAAKGSKTCLPLCETEWRGDGTCAMPLCSALSDEQKAEAVRVPRDARYPDGRYCPINVEQFGCYFVAAPGEGIPMRGLIRAPNTCEAWDAHTNPAAAWPYSFVP